MGAGNAVPVLVLRQGGKGVKLGLSAVAWACGGCLGISGFLSPCLPLSVVPVDQGGTGEPVGAGRQWMAWRGTWQGLARRKPRQKNCSMGGLFLFT